MSTKQEHLTHARDLRAAILTAPDVWLPRREIIVTWLDGFISRAGKTSYSVDSPEVDDLRDLEQFLRKQSLPLN